MAENSDKSDTGTARKPTTDWTEILKVVAMPLVITVVGLVINSSLSDRQNQESNLRLYADMMARREQADSELRKDMFTHILDKFSEPQPTRNSADQLELQVMNLELMAYNFNESIDLGPLFQHLRRQILDIPPGAPPAQTKRFAELRDRLEHVAVEVNERQLAVFGDTGVVVRTPADNLAQISSSPANIMFVGPSAVHTRRRSLKTT
jgi:hypothetical protein